jgi:3-oxoacyl-[acyl-carrier protein] reductase
MDLGIKNKVALVAASSKGLGREVARRLAEEKVRLVICAREQEPLKQTASWLKEEFAAEVLDVTCDLTDEAQVNGLVEKTVSTYGNLDILVTNCGGPPAGVFLEHDAQRWQQAVDLNLMSTIYLCRAAVPIMQKQKWGRIVMMTSVSVKQPLAGLILSNSVRAAVVGLAKSMANELGPDGILVNSVCPGFFLTERVKELAKNVAAKNDISPEEVLQKFADQSVLGRVADPEEFGSLVAFLCSQRAGYMTGTAIAIDGGLSKSLL